MATDIIDPNDPFNAIADAPFDSALSDRYLVYALSTITARSLPDLRMGISHCEAIKDFGSRELFTAILESEEEHIDWLQTQLRLIEQMGLQNFVQLQTKPNATAP